MNKLVLILTAGVFFAACGESKKTAEETKEVAQAGNEAVTYTVNTGESTLKWTGAKLADVKHTGTVKISEGSLSFEGEELKAGSFTVDMTSITNQDLNEETGQSKLVGHLKSGDFFMVDTFPSAKFEITGVEKIESTEGTHKITGNLTIKDQTHGISFPATITREGDKITANAQFEINRNEWGIVWGGSKETNEQVLGFLKDNLLQDMIGFEISLVAGK